MPLRPLTAAEHQRAARLTAELIEFTLIQPTATGLGKSIMDATLPVRNFLRDRGVHDYDTQGQGNADHGIKRQALLLDASSVKESAASLYRPVTKNGDPRIWFSRFKEFAGPDDMVAMMEHEGRLLLVNLTRTDIVQVLDEGGSGPLRDLLSEIGRKAGSVAEELLSRLRAIAAKGRVRSVMDFKADTAIGRTLEAELGIRINSLQAPDYKGIELKSYRARPRGSQENRKTLFAQVPNWGVSKFKSSREILDAFGYARDGAFKLYCTVSTKSPNAQGLFFKLNEQEELLSEYSAKGPAGIVATWMLKDLRAKLAAKHNETFWVSADESVENGHSYFRFQKVLHTRKPIAAQFDLLLEQGQITVDHLIKRDAKGRVSEKGPLFKIGSEALPLLFPPSRTYSLS